MTPTVAGQRRGFTLIELLIVIVIVGILVRIAIIKDRATKDEAMLATVKSDVHNVQVAEEAYLSDYKQYGTLAQLQKADMFQLSSGNTMKITTATIGFTITGTNKAIASTIKSCTVQIGSGGSTLDGKMTCP